MLYSIFLVNKGVVFDPWCTPDTHLGQAIVLIVTKIVAEPSLVSLGVKIVLSSSVSFMLMYHSIVPRESLRDILGYFFFIVLFRSIESKVSNLLQSLFVGISYHPS